MKKDEKNYLNMNYEYDGCGDYDKPVEYSQQSKEELKILQERKNKIEKDKLADLPKTEGDTT